MPPGSLIVLDLAHQGLDGIGDLRLGEALLLAFDRFGHVLLTRRLRVVLATAGAQCEGLKVELDRIGNVQVKGVVLDRLAENTRRVARHLFDPLLALVATHGTRTIAFGRAEHERVALLETLRVKLRVASVDHRDQVLQLRCGATSGSTRTGLAAVTSICPEH